MAKRKSNKRWIQRALGPYKKRKRGALHKQMKIPKGQKIPYAKLRKAAHAPGKLGRRARLAITLRSFHR